MSDPAIPDNTEKSGESLPQFGLSDVIDAFTAMRHEWRTQSKEGRQLAESIRSSTELLSQIESTIDQKITTTTDDKHLKNMVAVVIDLDISLQRAVEATSTQSALQTEQQTQMVESIHQVFRQSSFLNRWITGRFYRNVIQSLQSSDNQKPDTTLEGFKLVLVRLHRLMTEQNLTRIETTGELFNPETMKAISAVTSKQVEEGYVAEEITPAYFYQNQLVRFAEVRVARSQA